ncbi:Fido, protein-threonine AMPylation domain-containing protein [Pseudobutyrivibrio sp. ACV-2]|uniref:Fic/DOC family protein n=1 Tax=Pseudobutyrivibrio sp. ACV-2 TaxID=1520801 RepID=UPI0008957046|nr:Fic family protein [Pseudobutyrivibrio sp. ACV-2]SEB07354.1 Fido, protein-threonine AMPylation domain-containing protein [Pseudobutyrivibrio sp. ACV-2]
MRDPYLYEDIPVLKNKLGITKQDLLDDAEADYVVYRLKDLAINPLPGDYHTDHFLKMHFLIFQDIFEWAGIPRTISIYKEEDVLGGQSIEYSDPFDIVNDIHHVLKEMREKKWFSMNQREIADEFCDSLAALWRIHPFREGNTRTTVTFCCQFIDEKGFKINRKLFEQNAGYVRTALVAYNAYFSDGSDFRKKEYLQRIVYDAFEKE